MNTIFKKLFFVIALVMTTSIFSAMTVSGKFSAVDTNAFMDISVEEPGVVTGLRSDFLKLLIKGTANLDSCVVKKEALSYGVFNANSTRFLKDVAIYSGNTVLTDCNLPSLYIYDQNDHESAHPINVVLKGSTVINGPVVFETGNGKVYKGPNVVILGEIRGGSLINIPE